MPVSVPKSIRKLVQGIELQVQKSEFKLLTFLSLPSNCNSKYLVNVSFNTSYNMRLQSDQETHQIQVIVGHFPREFFNYKTDELNSSFS